MKEDEMKTAKKMICALILATVLLVMMSASVFAAEEGNAWYSVTVTENGDAVLSVMTDTPVTNAYLEISFNAEAYSFVSLEVNPEYVGVHSANAKEAGMVRLAFVSDGNYTVEESVCLLTITFSGSGDMLTGLNGKLQDAQGNALNLTQLLDTTALEQAIAEAEALEEALYTAESYAAVAESLEQARAVLANADATQDQVNTAATELVKAMQALQADKTELTKAVLAAQGLVAENYTAESYAAVEAALAAGVAVLEDNNASAEAVQAAAAALNEAMDALVLADASGSDAQVNTDELKKLVLKAEGLQQIQYSAESFAALESALATAKEVLENAQATQAQVDTTAAALRQAIDALVLVSGDAPDTGNKLLTLPLIGIVILSAAGIVATVCVLRSRKVWCAK